MAEPEPLPVVRIEAPEREHPVIQAMRSQIRRLEAENSELRAGSERSDMLRTHWETVASTLRKELEVAREQLRLGNLSKATA